MHISEMDENVGLKTIGIRISIIVRRKVCFLSFVDLFSSHFGSTNTEVNLIMSNVIIQFLLITFHKKYIYFNNKYYIYY